MSALDTVTYVGLSALAVVGWVGIGFAARQAWDRTRHRGRS